MLKQPASSLSFARRAGAVNACGLTSADVASSGFRVFCDTSFSARPSGVHLGVKAPVIYVLCGRLAPFERLTVGFETRPRKDHLERGNDEDGEHDDAVRLRVEGREEDNAGLESHREELGGEGKGNRMPATSS